MSFPTVLFVAGAMAIGALLKQIFQHTRLPYTVVLMVMGLAVGLLAAHVPRVAHYTALGRSDPHLLLHLFMPPLVFESAFCMDVHVFRRTLKQIVYVAGPGMLLTSALLAVPAHLIFPYGWSLVTACLLGSILSATDPVAVVAILRDLGASKELATLMEGESLLNDGGALVLFNIFLSQLTGAGMAGGEMAAYLARVALGGPLFGWLMGKLAVFWLSKVFNDALVEITITVAFTYLTFYLGEAFLGVSGVLAVVVFGLVLNERRTVISPEVEHSLHRFWDMLAYLANTLIFLLVGVVIAESAFHDVAAIDWLFLLALYVAVLVVRGFVLFISLPLLCRSGYGLSWQGAAVMTWGGLRGAVGLVMALIVAHTDAIDAAIRHKILFHCAGIVVLTLLLNATTIKRLLKELGMNELSPAKVSAMTAAVHAIRQSQNNAVNMLKNDRFLSDSAWSLVESTCQIDNPYHAALVDSPAFLASSLSSSGWVASLIEASTPAHVPPPAAGAGAASTSTSPPSLSSSSSSPPTDSAALVLLHNQGMDSVCPSCSASVPRVPRPAELAELAESGRRRFLKAETTSYWRQFESGLLGRDALRVLVMVSEAAMDTPGKLVTEAELADHWTVPRILQLFKAAVDRLASSVLLLLPPCPAWQPGRWCWLTVQRPAFETTVLVLICVNMVTICIELAASPRGSLSQAMRAVNYVFCALFTLEAAAMILALRRAYFHSGRCVFDFVLLVLAYVDLVIDETVASDGNEAGFSPTLLRMARVLRVLRFTRGMRLLPWLLPCLQAAADNAINRCMWVAYDVGKGFVVAQDEAMALLPRLVGHEAVATSLRERSMSNRTAVLKALGRMQRAHPAISTSVKTRQAIRSVFNHAAETLSDLRRDGVLDEHDARILQRHIEMAVKRTQENGAPCITPPSPESVVRGLRWLQGLESEVIDAILASAKLLELQPGEVLVQEGDDSDGVYVLVSGMVQVEFQHEWGRYRDMAGPGAVLGEMGVLTSAPRSATVACETAVRVFFISTEVLHQAMAREPALGTQLWRVCGIRTAVTLLSSLPIYRGWLSCRLRLHCEKAVLLEPAMGAVWELDERVSDAVLVQGCVTCTSTGQSLSAPATIPWAFRRVIFSQHPRLILIPANEAVAVSALGPEQSAAKPASIPSRPASSHPRTIRVRPAASLANACEPTVNTTTTADDALADLHRDSLV